MPPAGRAAPGGVGDPPPWAGRDWAHRALQLRHVPLLTHPFLSRGLGQVGAPPGWGAPLSRQGAKASLAPLGQSHLPWVLGDLSGAGGPPCLACPGNNRLKTREQFQPVKGAQLDTLNPPRCPPKGMLSPQQTGSPLKDLHRLQASAPCLPPWGQWCPLPVCQLLRGSLLPLCAPHRPGGRRDGRWGSPAAWPHPGLGKRGCCLRGDGDRAHPRCCGTPGMDTPRPWCRADQ